MGRPQVKIDKMTIRLTNGWQGDPVHLARKISEQVQKQASGLTAAPSIDLTLKGHFSGDARRAGRKMSERLRTAMVPDHNSWRR